MRKEEELLDEIRDLKIEFEKETDREQKLITEARIEKLERDLYQVRRIAKKLVSTDLKLIPNGSRIMVLPDAIRDEVVNKIVQPFRSAGNFKTANQGEVIAVGVNVERLKIKYRVYYTDYSGSVIRIGEQDCLVMDESDVLAYREIK